MIIAGAAILTAIKIAADVSSQMMLIRAQAEQARHQATQMANYASETTETQLEALQVQRAQHEQAMSLQTVQLMQAGDRERAILSSRLAESGIAGSLSKREIASSVIAEEMQLGTLETQSKWDSQMYRQQELSIVASGRSMINQARDVAASGRRDPALTGLQLISTGVSAAASMGGF